MDGVNRTVFGIGIPNNQYGWCSMIWMFIACQISTDSENIGQSSVLNESTQPNMEMIVTSAINGEYEPCG
mgnify:CR=1 FL=1